LSSTDPDPYLVLGVAPEATAAEVRAAYLELARSAHPDRHATDPAAQRSAEERMRRINAAWAVLGDPQRRAEHDRRTGTGPLEGVLITHPSRSFTPHHPDDPDTSDADDWRHEPDPYDPRTAVGRVLGAGPPLLFVAGLVLLAASTVTGIRTLFAVALAMMILAAFAFVGVPIIAVARSKANDSDRR